MATDLLLRKGHLYHWRVPRSWECSCADFCACKEILQGNCFTPWPSQTGISLKEDFLPDLWKQNKASWGMSRTVQWKRKPECVLFSIIYSLCRHRSQDSARAAAPPGELQAQPERLPSPELLCSDIFKGWQLLMSPKSSFILYLRKHATLPSVSFQSFPQQSMCKQTTFFYFLIKLCSNW